MYEQVMRCSCGKLYEIYSMYCGPQNVCPDCRAEIRRELDETWNKSIDRLRRFKYTNK